MLDNINENKLLFLDIETAGTFATLEEMEQNNEILFQLWDNTGDSYFRRHYVEDARLSSSELFKKYSALLPEFGRVVCISVGFLLKGGEKKLQSFSKGSEKDILTEMADLLTRVNKLDFTLCGHNLKTFDLPYLGKRMLINGVKPPNILPSHDTKPWEIKALDTKEMWNFGSFKGLSSLHLVCTLLGVDSPKLGEIKGSNIHKSFYIDNNINEITEYCERDVECLIDIVSKVKSL